MAVLSELMGDTTVDRGEDFIVRVNRLLYPSLRGVLCVDIPGCPSHWFVARAMKLA